MSVRSVAEALDIPERTVRRLLLSGKIGGTKIGRKWLVQRKTVEMLVARAGTGFEEQGS
jgi:excisionase family DNA binding protein